jgi:hypothetical protein
MMPEQTVRTITFGVLAGAIWSILPGTFSSLYWPAGQAITVVVAAVITGILTSLVLSIPLQRAGRLETLLWSVTALPVGAFVFGTLTSTVQFVWQLATGVGYRFVQRGFDPLGNGLNAAIYSSNPLFALFLMPLAIGTTFLLRLTLLSRATRNH